MYTFSYLQMNIGCMLIMLILLINHIKNSDLSSPSRSFSWLLISMMIYTLFDFLCGLQQNDAISLSRAYTEGINIGFFCSSMLVSYFSFMYCNAELRKDWLKDQFKVALSFLPVAISFVLFILSLRYKFFFYIDENCNYTKGNLYWLMLLLTYGYLLYIGISNLLSYSKKQNFLIRSKILTLSSFVVFPLFFGLIQAFYTGMSIICLGGTLAMIQVYINIQSNRITVDPLTQINNRVLLKNHLFNLLSNHHKLNKVFLAMIDVDNFKKINDTYGHISGDNALENIAEILCTSVAKYNGFVARYGGDEFCIVCNLDQCSTQELQQSIEKELNKLNESHQNPYTISLSIGFYTLDNTVVSVEDFISKADQELYKVKQEKKDANPN